MSDSTNPSSTADRSMVRNAAIAAAVVSPLMMLMPPRRMDWRFFMLTSTFSISSNYLIYEYTGVSIYQRVQNRFASLFPTALPEQAQRTKQLLREERMRREGLTEEQMRAIEYKKRNIVQRIWYGSEPEDWDAKRGGEHAKALAEGKGLGDLIAEQVKDVWSGEKGKKTEADDASPKRKEEDDGKKA